MVHSKSNGKDKEYETILLSIPAWSGSVHSLVIDSMMCAVRHVDAHMPEVRVMQRFMHRTMIDRMRQQTHDFAKENSFDYILWWDDDIVAPINVIEKLYQHQVEVVSAMTFMRTEPYGMFAYRCVDGNFDRNKSFQHLPLTFKDSGLVETDAVGTGCMLMKTDVVDQLDKPWWRWPEEGSEDVALCARLRKIGKKVYVDTDIEVGHLSFEPNVIGSVHHKAWCKQAEKYVKENDNIKSHPDYQMMKEMINGAK